MDLKEAIERVIHGLRAGRWVIVNKNQDELRDRILRLAKRADFDTYRNITISL
jgi:hypothetical protein